MLRWVQWPKTQQTFCHSCVRSTRVVWCLAAALAAQFPYAEAIVREALRLFPPATILNRTVKAGGFALTPDITVPEGVGVFPFVYGYQRSPEYWPAAEEFRPERYLPEGKHLAPTTPDAWTPFGRWAQAGSAAGRYLRLVCRPPPGASLGLLAALRSGRAPCR